MKQYTEGYLEITEYMNKQNDDGALDNVNIENLILQAYQLGFQAGASGGPHNPKVGERNARI